LFEEARELSIDLLKKWLVKYKFKDWTVTETSKLAVTEDYKRQRAESIAKVLSDPRRWHSHGRGIPMKELCGEELKLKIDDFGSDTELAKIIRDYFTMVREFVMMKDGSRHYMQVRGAQLCI
jgi:hypothetical protein